MALEPGHLGQSPGDGSPGPWMLLKPPRPRALHLENADNNSTHLKRIAQRATYRTCSGRHDRGLP